MATVKKPVAAVEKLSKVSSKDAGKLAAKTATASASAGTPSEDKAYKYPDKWKEPKSTALATDELWSTQLKRKEAQAIADALEETEKALKNWLIESLPKSNASGVSGKFCRVTVVKKEVPRVEDWPKFYAGIVAEYQKHSKKKDGQQDGAFALLQRSVGKSAVQEAWDAGKAIDGVGKFTAVTLSINKV